MTEVSGKAIGDVNGSMGPLLKSESRFDERFGPLPLTCAPTLCRRWWLASNGLVEEQQACCGRSQIPD
jgi:hypothetical protein